MFFVGIWNGKHVITFAGGISYSSLKFHLTNSVTLCPLLCRSSIIVPDGHHCGKPVVMRLAYLKGDLLEMNAVLNLLGPASKHPDTSFLVAKDGLNCKAEEYETLPLRTNEVMRQVSSHNNIFLLENDRPISGGCKVDVISGISW
jgi:hypothetical protein